MSEWCAVVLHPLLFVWHVFTSTTESTTSSIHGVGRKMDVFDRNREESVTQRPSARFRESPSHSCSVEHTTVRNGFPRGGASIASQYGRPLRFGGHEFRMHGRGRKHGREGE